ncbi:LOW QUALITY PROTEIN: hypothetical protein Cgig2_015357 [Carnegiea gigantea]|uniref:Sm domain-containing protein n=1 Tax=Carnegiea gigantea TaxID=171969 RepID=A0A9Q1K827_9CARY|nr:LOW QUALITY PROTEIN: hypothetical protein Cgig2_015357 [Carnegiea gigantea]
MLPHPNPNISPPYRTLHQTHNTPPNPYKPKQQLLLIQRCHRGHQSFDMMKFMKMNEERGAEDDTIIWAYLYKNSMSGLLCGGFDLCKVSVKSVVLQLRCSQDVCKEVQSSPTALQFSSRDQFLLRGRSPQEDTEGHCENANDSNAVAMVRKLLCHRMLLAVNDGRFFTGNFHCIDKQGNILLQDAVDTRRSSPSPMEQRGLGLILIPSSCQTSCHIDCSVDEQLSLLSLRDK